MKNLSAILENSRPSKERKDYNMKTAKKVMRLCSLGMVGDGDINEEERKCITEIVLSDYLMLKGGLDRLKGLDADFDVSKMISGERDSDAGIMTIDSKTGWSMSVDIKENQIYEKLKKKLDPNDESPKSLIHCYGRVRQFVETIIQRLQSEAVQQGLFTNLDSLSDREVFTELIDMVLLVKADNIITEHERVAFIAVAKIMKVVGSDSRWDKWMDFSKKKLLCYKLKKLYKFMLVKRRSNVTSNDVKTIEDAITSYRIQGPLCLGLQKAIRHNTNDFQKKNERRYRAVSWFAMLGFIISVWLLYFECATRVEYRQMAYEKGIELENPAIEPYREEGVRVVQKREEEKKKRDSLAAANNKPVRSEEEKQDSTSVAKNENVLSDKEYLREGINSINTNGDTRFLILIIYAAIIWFIAMWVVILKRIKWLMRFLVRVQWPLAILVSYWSYYKVLPETLLAVCYMPFLTLCMMVSIEVMIFMRERYMSKKQTTEHSSSKLLVVFVMAAIIADMCIGFLELPADYNIRMLLDKMASAVLLGCISFFVGKFLETDSMQKQNEMKDMQKSLEQIESFLSKKSDRHTIVEG